MKRAVRALTNEEREFYVGVVTMADSVTVHLQRERVSDQVFQLLKARNGPVIPRQTNEQLLALYHEVLDS